MLAERLEGNLLAAVQEVEKLKLLASDGQVTPQTIAAAVSDNARYNLFEELGVERLDLVQFYWWDPGVPGFEQAGVWLSELQAAARSIRVMSEYLERHPEALPHPALWQSLCDHYQIEIPFIDMWSQIRQIR